MTDNQNPARQTNVEPYAASTTDYLGCEFIGSDIDRIKAIAAAGSKGPTEVVYLYKGQPPQKRLRGKPTIAVGTYTITELYAGRTVENDFVLMEPADDLIMLMDGVDKRALEDAQHDAVAAETELRIVREKLSALQQQLSQPNVSVAKTDIIQWRKDWLEDNDPQDDTDCVTPFDLYLYGGDK